MTNQVLSIEQMQELKELGVDTSKASALWTAIVDKNYNPTSWLPILRNDFTPIEVLRERFPLTYEEGNVYYAFTLQDILEMLPDIGKGYANRPHLFKASDSIHWYCSYGSLTCEIKGKSSLEAAFNMLKWCKQNNYI